MEIQEIIRRWKKDANLFLYEGATTTLFFVSKDEVYILTDRPGVFIGKAGELYNKYSKILEENGYPKKVRWVDLFYKDVVELKLNDGKLEDIYRR